MAPCLFLACADCARGVAVAPTSSKNQGLCMVQGTVSSVLCFHVYDSSFIFPFLGKWEQDSEGTSRSSSFGSFLPGWKHRRAVCLHTVLRPWPAEEPCSTPGQYCLTRVSHSSPPLSSFSLLLLRGHGSQGAWAQGTVFCPSRVKIHTLKHEGQNTRFKG